MERRVAVRTNLNRVLVVCALACCVLVDFVQCQDNTQTNGTQSCAERQCDGVKEFVCPSSVCPEKWYSCNNSACPVNITADGSLSSLFTVFSAGNDTDYVVCRSCKAADCKVCRGDKGSRDRHLEMCESCCHHHGNGDDNDEKKSNPGVIAGGVVAAVVAVVMIIVVVILVKRKRRQHSDMSRQYPLDDTTGSEGKKKEDGEDRKKKERVSAVYSADPTSKRPNHLSEEDELNNMGMAPEVPGQETYIDMGAQSTYDDPSTNRTEHAQPYQPLQFDHIEQDNVYANTPPKSQQLVEEDVYLNENPPNERKSTSGNQGNRDKDLVEEDIYLNQSPNPGYLSNQKTGRDDGLVEEEVYLNESLSNQATPRDDGLIEEDVYLNQSLVGSNGNHGNVAPSNDLVEEDVYLNENVSNGVGNTGFHDDGVRDDGLVEGDIYENGPSSSLQNDPVYQNYKK